MNTIRNYLESMFAGLPNTPEIVKAKCELGQMMEDKYTELTDEGKSDNEAVAQVIAEFGNLDELGDALGISQILKEQQDAARNTHQLSDDEAKAYLDESAHYAFFHGLATLFAIVCPSGVILAATLAPGARTWMAAGIVFLLAAAAACVTLHVYSSLHMGRWRFLKDEPCTIDYGTAERINDLSRSTHDSVVLQRTIAILLFCTCYIPLVFLALLSKSAAADAAGVVLLLFMVAAGVLLLTVSASRVASCRRLLDLNGSQGAYQKGHPQKAASHSPAVRAVLSVYWPTITCLYLILSFLTFDWAATWIIWPVAGVVRKLIDTMDQTKGDAQ
ncbi:permease prefix domain 1-containing protein [uncultured Pseudoramibacter sp.]|uniref:permease prefix domain 1-containing protein n=1 Tax=uncultured Pseudoramibacter sp. TaxID=1623493 RepID=UPI0025D22D75|nr:permease prefix domain 1-containing protein [uncultured Pseudoramibacter sp.]